MYLPCTAVMVFLHHSCENNMQLQSHLSPQETRHSITSKKERATTKNNMSIFITLLTYNFKNKQSMLELIKITSNIL